VCSRSTYESFVNTAATSWWTRSAGVERKRASVEMKLALQQADSAYVPVEKNTSIFGNWTVLQPPHALFHACREVPEKLHCINVPCNVVQLTQTVQIPHLSQRRTSSALHGFDVRVLKGRGDNLLEKGLVSDIIEK